MSVAASSTLVAAIGTVVDAHRRLARRNRERSAPRRAARRSPRSPSSSPTTSLPPRTAPSPALGDGHVVVRERRDGREPRGRLQRAAPRHQRTCVIVTPVHDKSGVAAEAAAAGLPGSRARARPTVWLPDSYTWLALARANGARRRCRPRPRASGRPTSCSRCPQPLAESIGWDAEPPQWATCSTPHPTPSSGAISATPNGAPSSSARQAPWSRHPARRRCSRRSEPPQAISTNLTAAAVADPPCRTPCASTSSPQATTWPRPSTSSGTPARRTRRAPSRTSSRPSSSTRSPCGTTTAASRAATA